MAVAIPVQVQVQASSAVHSDSLRIFLVSSRKHNGRFVLPKGGVEEGENSRQAAVRELWEEAGLVGDPHAPSSGSISRSTQAELIVDDHKPHKKSPTPDPHKPDFIPRARYTGHEVLLKAGVGVQDDWPEMHQRERKAFTVQQAEEELKWREDIHTIFKRWAANLPKNT